MVDKNIICCTRDRVKAGTSKDMAAFKFCTIHSCSKVYIPVFPTAYLKQGGPPCSTLDKHQRKGGV